MASKVKIGIIGGSGFDDPDILQERGEIEVTTPYGKPSDNLITGKIKGVPCVLLARHGRRHDISPSNINYRANIHALKAEGCTHILATTACGSLREEIRPGDVVFIDQFIDRTFKREPTFYDGRDGSPRGLCHLQMVAPFCDRTRSVLLEVAKELGMRWHDRGTVVTIEGPRFSSKAESEMFRLWGCDVVNMTSVPEVVLAKEAAICYAAVGLPTDYDCWRNEPVHLELVLKLLATNAATARDIILAAVPRIAAQDWTKTREELEVGAWSCGGRGLVWA